MNALEVKDYLLHNEDKLKELLENIGCENINDKHRGEIRCAKEEGSNPTSIRIKLNENLSFSCFSPSLNGDIYTLVGWKLGHKDDFRENFKYVCSFLNIDGTFQKIERPTIFGGIFEEIHREKYNLLSNEMPVYPMETLEDYELMPNDLFLRDGISLETQIKYKVGYDWWYHRLIIPEFNCEGELIGITGRYNGYDYKDYGQSKYFPIIEFEKSKILFGYSQNYNHLINNNVWLFESQKSVMRMDSNNIYNCLALGGKFISPIQLKYIQNLSPKSIILALDEGVEEDEIIEVCQQLISKNIFNQYRVGYLYDGENEFLEKDSKDSPADLPIEKLKKFSKKVKWIN